MSVRFEVVHGPIDGPLGGLAADGRAILASDVDGNRLLRFDPDSGRTELVRRYLNRMRGIGFGPDGALYGCQSGGRRIVRMIPGGPMELTATRIDGAEHNHPCHLAVDALGAVWFSDGPDDRPAAGPQIFPYLPQHSVLRLRRDSDRSACWRIERMVAEAEVPRGIALTDDGRQLIVSFLPGADGQAATVRAYRIGADRRPAAAHILHRFTAGSTVIVEGLCIDGDGCVLACSGEPQPAAPGRLTLLGAAATTEVEVPFGRPTACTFDRTHQTLYVATANGYLLRTAASSLRQPAGNSSNE